MTKTTTKLPTFFALPIDEVLDEIVIQSEPRDRTQNLATIELLLMSADKIARRNLSDDDKTTLCVHIEAALAEIDDID